MEGAQPDHVAWIAGAGPATGTGGLGRLVLSRPSNWLLDTLLGFTAGITLAATAFSLLAAGAMLYVIVDELIPESHARGFEREASYARLVGFALMLVLGTALG